MLYKPKFALLRTNCDNLTIDSITGCLGFPRQLSPKDNCKCNLERKRGAQCAYNPDKVFNHSKIKNWDGQNGQFLFFQADFELEKKNCQW